MKKVDFVKIKAEFWGFGFGKGTSYGFNKAEDIIRERIKNGWEFCGYIPIEMRGTGEIQSISLIFQHEE